MICSFPECEKKHVAKGYCPMHYYRLRRHGDPSFSLFAEKPCSVEGCTRTHKGAGQYCGLHTDRVARTGHPGPPDSMHAPDGAGTITAKGYRTFNTGRKQRYEHRIVMEQILGRPLLRSEEVHHINGARADNRPENLELWSTSQPAGQRIDDKVAWAKELLALYSPASLAQPSGSAQ